MKTSTVIGSGRMVVMGAALLALSGMAAAQISAPPTQAPPATPEYVPPPPPPVAPQPPADPNNNKNVVQQLPDMPIDPPLRDKDGKLVALTEPLFWQAMKHNVSVTDTVRKQSGPFLAKRLRKYEKVVSDNADLMRQVNEGVIDNAQLLPQRAPGRQAINQGANGGLGLSALMQVLKPLVGDNIREEMQRQGIMTRIQAGQNAKVMQKYAAEVAVDFEAKQPKLADNASEDDKKKRKETIDRERMRQQMYLWIDEAVFAYGNLADDAGKDIEKYLKGAGVDAGTVSGEVKAIKAATDRETRIAATKKLFLKLPIEKEREILNAVRATREPLPEDDSAADATASEPKKEATPK